MFEPLAIFCVALAGGCLPLLVRWTDRLLHSALALSTGIFLGAVFLHMLPTLGPPRSLEPVGTRAQAAEGSGDVVEAAPRMPAPGSHTEGDHDHAPLDGATPHDHGSFLIWFFVLVGVLGVYLVEGLVLRSHDHDDLHRHRAVAYASLVGLAVHSITNGLGLAAAHLDPDAARPVFIAIMAHKGFETFSLTTVFQLAQFPRRRILLTMAAYATVTPLGALLGRSLFQDIDPHVGGVVLALAAGTFLYVCLCELLPELFHHKEDSLAKIALLAVGIGVMVAIGGAGA